MVEWAKVIALTIFVCVFIIHEVRESAERDMEEVRELNRVLLRFNSNAEPNSVVRCKDCVYCERYMDSDIYYCTYLENSYMHCPVDGYCHRAKGKTMSVLIKGMEMPKNCGGCKFFAWKRGVGQHCAVDDRITFHATIDGMDVAYERNGNCPLVPVPPAVVRCKDCAYQKDCAFAEWLGMNGNGYCSCGERKDDE